MKYACALKNSKQSQQERQLCLSYTNKMHIYNKIHVLFITFFSYVFRYLLRHPLGELLCTLKTIITFCDYNIGLQPSHSYFKKKNPHVCFTAELQMLKSLCENTLKIVLNFFCL